MKVLNVNIVGVKYSLNLTVSNVFYSKIAHKHNRLKHQMYYNKMLLTINLLPLTPPTACHPRHRRCGPLHYLVVDGPVDQIVRAPVSLTCPTSSYCPGCTSHGMEMPTTSQRASTAYFAGTKTFPTTKESHMVYVGTGNQNSNIDLV
jgi:hypothetical protein